MHSIFSFFREKGWFLSCMFAVFVAVHPTSIRAEDQVGHCEDLSASRDDVMGLNDASVEDQEVHNKAIFGGLVFVSVSSLLTIGTEGPSLYHLGFAAWALRYTKCTSTFKNSPHFRYLARPVYNLLGGNAHPLMSVPAVFFVMDLVMHQFLQQVHANLCVRGYDKIREYTFEILWVQSISWMMLSIPVIYSHLHRPRT